MKRFINKTAATLGLATMSAFFVPQAQALNWVVSPDAKTTAFGDTVIAATDQINLGYNNNQAPGVYGAGFTVNGATDLQVKFDANLYTWDSYNAIEGYYDAFIVTISTLGYYWETEHLDPMPSGPNTFVWGGKDWTTESLEEYKPLNPTTLVAHSVSPTTYYVSVVLDTKSQPDSDQKHPSYGSFHVTSVVPEPETYAMMLVGLGLLGFTARSRKSNTFA